MSSASQKRLYLSSPLVGEYLSSYLEVPAPHETRPTVFCVHGRPGDSGLMAPFARWAESKEFGFYAYDQFGVGGSKNIIDFKLDPDALKIVFSDELGHHLNNAGASKLILVAHSFGGVIASLYIEGHGAPSNLEVLVLSGFCAVRAEFLDYNYQRLDRLADQFGGSRADEIFFQRHICDSNKLSSAQLASIRATPYGSVSIDPSYLDQLRMVSCPSVLTFGESDILSDRQADLCLNALQNGLAVKVPGAAHYPFIENGEFYFKALEIALKEVGSLL